MSLHAKKSAVVLFMAGALLVGVSMVFAFGGRRIFTRHQTFLCYFNQSVNGLSAGSVATFRGVPIGNVESIKARVVPEGNSRVEVLVNFDMDRLRRLGVDINLADPSVLQSQVRDGLRGKLEVAHYTDGSNYLDFDYHPEAGPPPALTEDVGIGVIPTVPSSAPEVVKSIQHYIDMVQNMDFQSKADMLNRYVNRAQVWLARNPPGRFSDQVLNQIKQFQGNVNDFRDPRGLQSLIDKTAHYQGVATDAQATVQAFSAKVGKFTQDAQSALDKLDAQLASVRTQLQPGGPVQEQLIKPLQDVSQAAGSLREKTDQLEQSPGLLK